MPSFLQCLRSDELLCLLTTDEVYITVISGLRNCRLVMIMHRLPSKPVIVFAINITKCDTETFYLNASVMWHLLSIPVFNFYPFLNIRRCKNCPETSPERNLTLTSACGLQDAVCNFIYTRSCVFCLHIFLLI